MNNAFINLSKSCWQTARGPAGEEVWVKGCPYIGQQKQTAQAIADSLPASMHDEQSLRAFMLRYDGFHALVCQHAGRIVAGVDRLRSFPLFYSLVNGRFYLSDNAEWIRLRIGDTTMDPIAQEEFQLVGYVTGRGTLFPNIKQLQAGECLVASPGDTGIRLECHRYYRYLYAEPEQYNEAALADELEHVTTRSIERLIDYADGRQIVVPLSGGYDSRLIASQLKRLRYDNVLTFTYGAEGNKEAQYSKHVADSLGLNWRFVEYTRKSWSDAWREEDRWAYQKWASAWSSLIHVQDWLAVRTLKNEGALSANAVFVPGHIARNDIPRWLNPEQRVDPDLLGKTIFSDHYYLAPVHLESRRPLEEWHRRLADMSEQKDATTSESLMTGMNKWDWQERQAKYIVNSVRVYEHFGYGWWLPLWDNDFTEYWQRVPFSLRKKRETYYQFVNRTYSTQAGLPDMDTLGNGRDPFFKKALMKLPFSQSKLAEWAWYKAHAIALKKQHLDVHAASIGIPEEDLERMVKSGYTPMGVRAHYFLKDATSYVNTICTHRTQQQNWTHPA